MGLLSFLRPKPQLDEDETRLVSLLKQGPKAQKNLLLTSGFNPVKFNRVLRRLEEAGIAKREPHGRENVVRLL